MSDSTVTVLIRFEAQTGKGEMARRALGDLISTVLEKESDCLSIRLHQGLDDPDRLFNIERWTSREAYEGPHMQTPHLQAFIEDSREFLTGPPEITFWREADSGGDPA